MARIFRQLPSSKLPTAVQVVLIQEMPSACLRRACAQTAADPAQTHGLSLAFAAKLVWDEGTCVGRQRCGILPLIRNPHSEMAMASTVEALEAEALQLSTTERGRLIERLIASLDADPGVDDAWAAKAERRDAQIESGAVSLIHGPEALAKLKAEFR